MGRAIFLSLEIRGRSWGILEAQKVPEYFRSQGVSGRDLVAFSSAETLSEELKTTLFVARKVLVLRDEHAAGHA